MLRLGDYNTLRIVKSVDFGLYLDGGEEGEILLPQRYVTKDMHVGDEIEVFLYLDQEERPVATTEHPSSAPSVNRRSGWNRATAISYILRWMKTAIV